MGKDLLKLVYTGMEGFQSNMAPVHSIPNFNILILEYLIAQDVVTPIMKSALPFVINGHFSLFWPILQST